MAEVPVFIQQTAKQQEVEPLQDHCGVMGVYIPGPDRLYFQELHDKLVDTGEMSFMRVQTRGYDGAGFLIRPSHGPSISHKDIGPIDKAMSPEVLERYRDQPVKICLKQTRYATKGLAKSVDNTQPLNGIHIDTGEEVAVVHNGQFALSHEGPVDEEESDTVSFFREVTESKGDNWNERIIETISRKKGAYSLIIATSQGMFLTRDRLGVRPLSYGQRPDGTWIAASETTVLDAEGVTRIREVMPGQVIQINDEGAEVIHEFETDGDTAMCSFEDVYVADGRTKIHANRPNPDRINHAETTEKMRRNSGRNLAREAPMMKGEADFVIGIPGTAIPGGEAYAETLKLEYKQAITDRDPNSPRSFMQPDIEEIYKQLLDQFDFDAKALRDKSVCLVDDSVVRGNVSKVLVELLRNVYGVREVHLRVLSPPIDKECYLGVNTKTKEELIAGRHNNDIDKIAAEIGVDSLAYLSGRGLRKSITGSPDGNGLCMGCMAGEEYPVDKYGNRIAHIPNSGPRINLYTDRSIIASKNEVIREELFTGYLQAA